MQLRIAVATLNSNLRIKFQVDQIIGMEVLFNGENRDFLEKRV